MVELVLTFSHAGFPLSKKKVCSLVYQYAQVNKIKGFSKKKKKAGRDYLKGFLKRNPEIRIKKVHNLSVNRAMGANPEVIRKFFDQLEQVLYDLNIVNPQQIWNCDESGCQDVPKEDEVVGETGVPQYHTVPKEHGETSTILTFANAAGLVVPPVIIHKGAKCLTHGESTARWVSWLEPPQRAGLIVTYFLNIQCDGLGS